MKRQRTHPAKIVASFGAGLACAYLAPSAEGATIVLTPSPATVPYQGGGFQNDVPVHLSPGSFVVGQYNDGIGKSFFAGAGLLGFLDVPASQVISTGQSFIGFIGGIGPSWTVTRTYGFKTTANQVGWVRINFGGAGGVTYLAAAYNDEPGCSIHSGGEAIPCDTTPPVPEPSMLALAALGSLALGARSVRQMRKKQQVQ